MKLTPLLLLLLLTGNCLTVPAQEQQPEPRAMFKTRFPFTMLSGGVIIIRATINNYKDSLNFILDTGSGGISLDSTTCEELNIPLKPSDVTIRGIAGLVKVKYLYNGKLNLPGYTVDGLNFHVNDYEILTSVYGVKIDGIVGYSFLNRHIVRLDYDSLQVEVFSPGEFKYPRNGYVLKPLISSIPVLNFRFRDRKRFANRFYFDTGAGLSFLLSKEFANDSSVLATKRKPVLTQAEGLGGKMSMSLTVVKEVAVGPYKFKKVPTFIFDDLYNITNYPFLGGLVGNDLLRRFNVILNYPKRQIHIIPNKHFNDFFDYAYTGLGIYYIEGKIVVEDVVPQSPGDEGGFRSGDVIVAINNNFSNNIQTYKAMMQTLGERLKIVIQRDGELEVLYLKPKSIL